LDGLEIWLVSKFPIYNIPPRLIESINDVKKVITLEEHQGQCGLHETLASLLLKQLDIPIKYHTLFATGYPSGRYGSQSWHQEENNLGGKNLENKIIEFIHH
jgi:transketolase